MENLWKDQLAKGKQIINREAAKPFNDLNCKSLQFINMVYLTD